MKLNLINNTDYLLDDFFILRVCDECALYLETKKDSILNLIFVSNEKIKQINLEYRKKDYITDVISFPNDENNEIGDIFISLDRATEQALEYKHSFEREVAFLIVHGILHVHGYDHINKEDELVMFKTQDIILEILNISR